MAVQAQYPSNVLFLNRSVQEGKNSIGNDYSLQPQPGGGGGFIDQSNMMLFSSNGGGGGGGVGTNNPRKRLLRETTTPTINSQMNNNPFSIQSQSHHPNLIDLTHFHTPHQTQPQPQPNVVVVSTGLRLSFGEQQQQQLRLQLQQQQQQQRQSLSPQSSSVLLASDDLAAQFRQHKHEIDQFLQSQGEELRRTLAEKRQRHYRALLGAAEEAVVRRLREKEAEAEKAMRRNSELEARAARLSAEAQVWQARARAQEATAAELQAQLQQAMMCGGGGCALPLEELGGEAEDAESAYVDPERVSVASGPRCKLCGKRAATVVVLPCRHLCLCSECGSVAQSCPLCLSFRESSVEVFFS